MYIGCCRNRKELDSALALAHETFRPEAQYEVTSRIVSPSKPLSGKDVVVLVCPTGELCGAIFLIDRVFFKNNYLVQGTFLSLVCIAESARGNGLSRLLMEQAIAEASRRGSTFAIVIARRTVDYYYNKFYFWGLSQYSKISLKFNNIDTGSQDLCSFESVSEKDLPAINDMYQRTYSRLYGSCVRTIDNWKHILWKANLLNLNFVACKKNNTVIGYVLFSGNEIQEVATGEAVSSYKIVHDLAISNSTQGIILHIPPEHPIVKELSDVDFSVSLRQCGFGGHMVRILDENALIKNMENELHHEAKRRGIRNYSENYAAADIELCDGKVNITLHNPSYSYQSTCFLMGADYLSRTSSGPSLYDSKSFNIPLVDQV